MDSPVQTHDERDVASRRKACANKARYAIYYAPHRDSAWWQFGCAWLGRDPISDTSLARFVPPALESAGLDANYLTRITTAPRRYGFHATLKAPFRLQAGYTAHDVYLQADNLSQSLMAAVLPPAQLCVIDGFVALSCPREGQEARVTANAPAVNAVAAQCVSAFDNLRARADAKALARRYAPRLTPRQENLLAEWGYPYVFQEFRFHMTLTNIQPPGEQRVIMDVLAPCVARLNAQPLLLDALLVYHQPVPDAPFVVTRRYGFDGSLEIYRDND